MTHPQQREQPWEWRRCWVARLCGGCWAGTRTGWVLGAERAALIFAHGLKGSLDREVELGHLGHASPCQGAAAGAPAINTSALTSFLSL